MPDYEQIQVEQRGHVALLTLQRPDRLNAWTPRMSEELMGAIEQANADSGVGAIVLTGAGRGFCAGADVRDAFQRREDAAETPRSALVEPRAQGSWVHLVRESKPLIAAVNGVAVGVGLTMILPFDLILASERARFGMFFVKMGLVPELASTYYLVQRVGFATASEMCLSGRLVEAEEAAARGLANRVVPAEKLVDEALAEADALTANPDRQLRMIKQLLTRNGSDPDLDAVMKREFDLLRTCYSSPEHSEAIAAFTEKRAPRFR
ncbi:MAG TPA: enoyl-CoA hydratase [Deltaproteobacteria bacterium]|jgi:enoyl-CoA hydratase/carnithine racemase|nr:enoyl-CoA hydratase [Deltaproteobacteria bacterium]